ncbi:Flp pilus assembly protein CpaB [Sphingomonas immobilis]|uniref:Flp pilus assembly protein CpaB n=1 Tax=Sphingomonas immobilis TaxID=3063997 RepID=A0ABT8ZW72_9SPHN|nr:Flp pilus assembly protein CpaB [Sphingomonas sp. CA1-15]MDO7841011.1 Flp pilus assembly protein CpaB [Sphingomonas sp. CA1-15]
MDSRKIILLVGALVVAAVTAFMARSLVAGSAAPQAAAAIVAPAAPVGPEVLVATKSLPLGTILDATALKYQPWPKELVENVYFIKGTKDDVKSLIGTVVRTPITAGQPITQGTIVKPGDRGFLAAALGPGMRAVTVPTPGSSSVSGFVFPGDRVDVVLTQTVPGASGPPLKVSETVMRNLRVLATDTRTDNTVNPDTGKTEVRGFNNVTLEATPRMAEQIAVAQTLGSLSLSLRSLADNASELEQAIARGDVNVPDSKDPKAEKAMITKVAGQPSIGNSTFSTGADVSRFQRRTVPNQSDNASGTPGADGPVVRVARGNNVTAVAVGEKK